MNTTELIEKIKACVTLDEDTEAVLDHLDSVEIGLQWDSEALALLLAEHRAIIIADSEPSVDAVWDALCKQAEIHMAQNHAMSGVQLISKSDLAAAMGVGDKKKCVWAWYKKFQYWKAACGYESAHLPIENVGGKDRPSRCNCGKEIEEQK